MEGGREREREYKQGDYKTLVFVILFQIDLWHRGDIGAIFKKKAGRFWWAQNNKDFRDFFTSQNSNMMQPIFASYYQIILFSMPQFIMKIIRMCKNCPCRAVLISSYSKIPEIDQSLYPCPCPVDKTKKLVWNQAFLDKTFPFLPAVPRSTLQGSNR